MQDSTDPQSNRVPAEVIPPQHSAPQYYAGTPHAMPAPAAYPARKSKTGMWVVLGLLAVGGLLLVGSLVGFAGVFGLSSEEASKLTEVYHSDNRNASDKIAILKLEGVIMEGDGFVKQQIDHIKKDKSIKAIVLRVDSPGGTVTGSDFMHHHLKEMLEDRKIPIVVSMGSICASGGYYVAMAVGQQPTKEKVIYAEPTTWCGSIGVLIPHYDLSGLADQFHVVDDSVKSHELKAMGGMLKKMTERERAILKDLVDQMFDRFKGIVKEGRPSLSDDKLTEVATGQIFTTKQAIAHGLVDQEGFIEAAILRAAELANLQTDHYKTVKYKSQPSLMSILSGDVRAQAPAEPFALPLAALREAASPRPYYIYSSLPSLSVFDFAGGR